MESHPSVLLIEPRQHIRTTVEMALAHAGVRVFSAINLDSALLQLRVWQPDLLIIGGDNANLKQSSSVAKIRALSAAPLFLMGDEAGPPAPAGMGAYRAELARALALLVRPRGDEPCPRPSTG